jgi:hypothetical protein
MLLASPVAVTASVVLLAALAILATPRSATTRGPQGRPGDANWDGQVNGADIGPFVLAVCDGPEWEHRFRKSHAQLLAVADLNRDGQVTRRDVPPFVFLLRSTGSWGEPPRAPNDGGKGRTLGAVDLDIDSDNTNGTARPDRSEAEESIEDQAGLPGKFVLVNNDDDDRSGGPDKDQNGPISQEQDDLVPIVLEIAPGSGLTLPDEFSYRLTYPTNVRVWKSRLRGYFSADVVPSGVTQLQMVWVLGDMNCDGVVDFDDINPFVLALSDPAGYEVEFPSCNWLSADCNGDGDVNFDDIDAFVARIGGDPTFTAVRLWVEGLSPSAGAGDVRILAEADTDQNGAFDTSDAVRATVLSLTGAPTSGALGTAVTWTLQPAISPAIFTVQTAATWEGIYRPDATAPTEAFVAEYAPQLVHEVSQSGAVLVVGECALASGDPGQAPLAGTLDGDLTFALGGLNLRRTMLFTVTGSYTFVHGYRGAGEEVLELPIVDPADPSWGQALTLENAAAVHVLLAVLAERNAYTQTTRPTALRVELVSQDAYGVELDRAVLLVYLEQRQDFGPTRWVYYSDWERPLVFVSSPVDPNEHPTLLPLLAQQGGRVFPVFQAP